MKKLPYGITLDDIDQYGDAVIELAAYYSPDNYENDGLSIKRRVAPGECALKELQAKMECVARYEEEQ